MDEQEKIVEKYLKAQGYKNIEHEPDGNIPPDFLLSKKIAIEVRRLNQNVVIEDDKLKKMEEVKFKGLEEVRIPLYDSIIKILSEFDYQPIDKSYFVRLKFKRPLPDFKIVKKKLKEMLSEFYDNPKNEKIELKIIENLTIKISPASKPMEKFFNMGGILDLNRGGWVFSEMEKNLELCSNKKLKKVEKFREKYEIWWLALVDNIGYGLSEKELNIDPGVVKDHNWDKILIINPKNFRKAMEF